MTWWTIALTKRSSKHPPSRRFASGGVDVEQRFGWLERRVREMSRGTAADAITKTISGLELPKELAAINLFDVAA
jgi:hypothetical protein